MELQERDLDHSGRSTDTRCKRTCQLDIRERLVE